MSPLTFFGIAAVALAVLCYLDYRRTVRREANRRTWVRYFAAMQHRRECKAAWEAAQGIAEERAMAAYLQAHALVGMCRAECRGKCPKHLI